VFVHLRFALVVSEELEDSLDQEWLRDVNFRIVNGTIELDTKVAMDVFALIGEGKFCAKLFNNLDDFILVLSPDQAASR
jgi:hypothetical protein